MHSQHSKPERRHPSGSDDLDIGTRRIDLSRWAVVSYCDDTGLGRQAADLRKIVGIGRLFALPSERIEAKSLPSSRDVQLRYDLSEPELRTILDDVQGVIFLERTSHHPGIARVARKMGITIVCVPNWEHFAGWHSLHNLCDFFICPTKMTWRILRWFGFAQALYLPCPLDPDLLPARTISGKARHFVHNGGLMNKDDRKATADVIEAFKCVDNPDIRLTVRLQRPFPLPSLDSRIEVRFGNLEHPGRLYETGDVAIQPSKLEGIGLSVLEAVLCGMPVITTDYPPMNEFVRDKELLCATHPGFRKVKTTHGIYHSHLKIPRKEDLVAKIKWCAGNDLSRISENNRSLRDSTFSPDRVREKWLEALSAHITGQLPELIQSSSPHPPAFSSVTGFAFRRLRRFLLWKKGITGQRQ